jgi:hypothetical protein
MKKTGVLEEAQVLPLTLHRIMDGTRYSMLIGKPGTRRKPDREVQLLAPGLVRCKIDFLDLPGRLQTKGHAE